MPLDDTYLDAEERESCHCAAIVPKNGLASSGLIDVGRLFLNVFAFAVVEVFVNIRSDTEGSHQ